MEENSISIAFGDSLTNETAKLIGEYAEIGLDLLLDEGILKNIPVMSTFSSVYQIGKTVRERHHLVKLLSFINEMNKGICTEEKRRKYRDEFYKNESFRKTELEYIFILIDRYIDLDKPPMLAKLYLAYLDGKIIWQEFLMYAEIVDRFIGYDASKLVDYNETVVVHRNRGGETVLRLVALGLMAEITNKSPTLETEGGYGFAKETLIRSVSTDKTYKRTEFGDKLVDILH